MTTPRTGIFYHPSFSRRSYLTVGRRLADFPGILRDLLAGPQVVLFESQPASDELILKVHTPDLIRAVAQDPLWSTARHSVGGVVAAAERIWLGELLNAFAFIGAGGHHAGRDFFGGYCCFNDVAIAIERLREVHGLRRVAILDTDAHHGDGTRDIYRDDPTVLHICLCGNNYVSADGTKVDVAVYRRCFEAGARSDKIYFEAAEAACAKRVPDFRPDFLVWYFGFDGHRGDYGDLGLTATCYNRIVRLVLDLAGQICGGRLLVVLGGGSRADLASSLIPPIIACLADAAG